MDFSNFLDIMSSETGKKIRVPDLKQIKNKIEEKSKVERQPSKPEPKPTKKVVTENTSVLTEEESIEQIYEITSIVMKTIRQTFPNKTVRHMAFESVQNAINMVLGENHQPSITTTALYQKPVQEKQTISTKVMTEQEWENMPTVSYDDGNAPLQVRMNPALIEENEYQAPSQYTRHIDIKPGNGLVGVSEQDIRDLKILAGIK